MEHQNPILTVVIPHLNYVGLERCLRTLKMMTPIEYRVIIVDQSPNDYSHFIREGLAHQIIKTYRNLGFAKACNVGLRLADTEYVMLLNDDVEFIYGSWWEDLMAEFASMPGAACVNPHSIRNPKGSGEVEDQYPFKDVLAGEVYSPEEIEQCKNIFGKARYNGICMFAPVFRLEALCDLGKKEGSPYGIALLDESFGAGSGEDYDLCRRFGLADMACMGSARVIVWHYWGKTKNNMPEEGGLTNHGLIAAGYKTMHDKWGPAREQQEPVNHPDGWDVQGRSGPKEPLNDKPWATVNPL